MRAALSQLEVRRPRDLAQALREMASGDGSSRVPDTPPTPIAGGTDLFVYLNAGASSARAFVDLWGLRELRGIRARGREVALGALTTFSEIREHPGARRRYPSLVAAAAEVGGRQIQNRATLAGNIANASPAGDSLPPLLALDAAIHAQSVRGERVIPFEEFYRGYRVTALEPDELITSIHLPPTPPRTFQFFRKVGTRRAQSISKVVFGGALQVESKGRIGHVRLAYGSVAPVPLRARRAEAALLGARPSRAAAEAARAALVEDIAPIDDIRSDRLYRLAVAANVLQQFLRAAHRGFARS